MEAPTAVVHPCFIASGHAETLAKQGNPEPLCAKGASLAFEGICQLLDLPWGPVAGMTSSCADFTNPVNSEGFFQTLGTK